MTLTESFIILSTLCGPVLAVQAQKWLERFRESENRRLYVFKVLMATRGATTSHEHVQGLNMIDLEFHGDKFSAVRKEWKTYLDLLGSFPQDDQHLQAVWGEKRSDRLASLLMEMGKSLGYEFDEVHIKKGIYSPEAHSKLEYEQSLVRTGLIDVLHGKSSLKMDVVKLPTIANSRQE